MRQIEEQRWICDNAENCTAPLRQCSKCVNAKARKNTQIVRTISKWMTKLSLRLGFDGELPSETKTVANCQNVPVNSEIMNNYRKCLNCDRIYCWMQREPGQRPRRSPIEIEVLLNAVAPALQESEPIDLLLSSSSITMTFEASNFPFDWKASIFSLDYANHPQTLSIFAS